MQELGPPLHKVASLFAIQFLFLNFSVVFQLLKGQASKQGPERLCGFHPCTQNSLGQDAEQNYLILCALSWAAGLETSREPFQPEFLYESATLPTCAAGITAAGVQHRGGVVAAWTLMGTGSRATEVVQTGAWADCVCVIQLPTCAARRAARVSRWELVQM